MKKIISWIVMAALLLQLPVAFAAGDPNALPKVGQTVSGFQLIEIQDCEAMGGKTALFEHQKTGAQLLYVQNSDQNRFFNIGFKTPTMDDTGVNHVLEHCTMSGSEQYPFNNLLFSLLNQTYSTFVNAMTTQCATLYPCGSASEAQLRKMMDVYLNCTFYPSVYEDELIFEREAAQYKLSGSDQPIEITGAVYNEMRGNESNISRFNLMSIHSSMFPTTMYRFNAGGDPAVIPELTYQQTLDAHTAYYHPSNSLTVLYGDLDYKAFLQDIDENYFSKFEKKEIVVEEPAEPEFKTMKDDTYEFPVAADSTQKDIVNYSISLGRMNSKEVVDAVLLSAMMMQADSPLYQEYAEQGLGGSLQISTDTGQAYPVLTVSAVNVDSSQKQAFVKFVEEKLGQMAEEGFSEELLQALIRSQKSMESMMLESGQAGLTAISNAITGWSCFGDPNFLNTLYKTIEAYDGKELNQVLVQMLHEKVLENPNKAVVTVVAKKGLAEEKEAACKQLLEEKKANMTSQQVEELVQKTKTFDAWVARPEQGDPSQLQAITIDELPLKTNTANITEINEDGIRLLQAEANTGKLDSAQFYFDTSGLAQEELHYYILAMSQIGALPTHEKTLEQLSVGFTESMTDFKIEPSTIVQKNGDYTPVLRVKWTAIDENMDAATELVKEVVTGSDFSQTKLVEQSIVEQKLGIENQISSDPYGIAVQRNMAAYSPAARYVYYLGYEDYYQFLTKVETQMQTQPQEVTEKLEQVLGKVLRKDQLTVAAVTNAENMPELSGKLMQMAQQFPSVPLQPQKYDGLPAPDPKEGIAINANVNFNVLGTDPSNYGITDLGKYFPIALYVQDQYLQPQLRFSGGAYGAFMQISSQYFLVSSYRDPQIAKTYDIMYNIPAFLRDSKLTQEELDMYILKAYSNQTVTNGPVNSAYSEVMQYLSGYTKEDQDALLEQMKSVTISDFAESANVLQKMLHNAALTSAGSQEALEQNKQMFNTILSLIETDKTITRAEFAKLMYGGEDPMAAAIAQGLYLGDGEGNYFEQKPITKAEFAVFISRLIRIGTLPKVNEVVPSDMDAVPVWAKDAVLTLVQAGLIPVEAGKFEPERQVTTVEIEALLTAVSEAANRLEPAA